MWPQEVILGHIMRKCTFIRYIEYKINVHVLSKNRLKMKLRIFISDFMEVLVRLFGTLEYVVAILMEMDRHIGEAAAYILLGSIALL